MNLEGKKSVTRNGVEYPVMWVWDNASTKRLAIVIMQSPVVLAVPSEDGESFVMGSTFNVHNWSQCVPQKEPTLRHYNDEELKGLVGEILYSVDGSTVRVVMSWGTSIGLSMGNSYISPLDLLNDWTHKDGSPCGIEV